MDRVKLNLVFKRAGPHRERAERNINADLGTTLSKIITEDAPVQESLDGVAERTQALMDDAGYYTWTQ